MCENVNCVLIVSQLKLHCITFYPIENFQKHLAPEFLNIDIKRSLQKLMRQLHVSLIMDRL